MGRPASNSASDAPASMVARVALIINSFDRAGKQLRIDEVAAHTGLPRSSTHRILTQLHTTGLLTHGPDGYCLAASSLSANRVVDYSELRGAASPVLRRLAADTSLVVHLGVLLGADVVYLDKVGDSSGVAVPTRVAGRTPAHASALGKAMLATLSPRTSMRSLPILSPSARRRRLPACQRCTASSRRSDPGTDSRTTTRNWRPACRASRHLSEWLTVKWQAFH